MSAPVQQLPRGRHRLSRDEVLSSQRGRMLAGVAEAVAEKGFARTTVADVIARAGVGRETFYEQFSGKEECFLAALDLVAGMLLEVLSGAVARPASDPLQRLENLLSAYLEALASEPALARMFLIDAFGAGQAAIERRFALQQRFVDAIASMFGSEADRFACEALVAAVSSLVTARIGTGRADELPELRQPIVELARMVLG